MMKDYVEALEMCKKQAVQIVGLQNKQKELEAEKQEADEAYDDAFQQIEFLQKENESLKKRLADASKKVEALESLLVKIRPFISDWDTPMDILAEFDNIKKEVKND